MEVKKIRFFLASNVEKEEKGLHFHQYRFGRFRHFIIYFFVCIVEKEIEFL